MSFILSLGLIILSTKLAGDLTARLGQPAVLGKLLAGILLGPAVLGWINPGELIGHFSEIGVLLLMFIAGLETDMDQLRKNWMSSVAVAAGGIILPFFGGYSLSLLLGLPQPHALFMGLLLCATSVSITVQSLKEMNQLGSREGTTILGAAVVDDVVVVVLFAVMMSLLGDAEAVSLPVMLLKKTIFFIVIIAVSFAVPFLIKLMSKIKVSEGVMSGALLLCFGYSYFAEYMGVAGIIGAFAAGLALSRTTFRPVIEQKVEPIAYTLFVPVFFVSIGLNISFEGLGSQALFIVLLTIVAIITKMAGGGLGARLTGFSSRQSLAIGSGMVSRGEVALIIASAGLSAGLLPASYYTAIVMVVLLTTLITPPLIKLFFQKSSEKAVAPMTHQRI
jgi:monovalent cation:proton antiporter-2 (CPA2) family protein